MANLDEIRQMTIDGAIAGIAAKVQEALDQGVAAETILNEGLVSGMDHVGSMFEAGEYFVPEMLIAARTMDNALSVLKPHLIKEGAEFIGTVAIGTVKGDLHDIGKRLVAMMLEGAGFQIIDLGVDVKPELFVEEVRNGATLVAVSALLTTTMTNMGDVAKALEEAGLRQNARFIVGGAPVTEEYAESIGADGYADTAIAAVRVARDLVGARRHDPV
ncbi:MAG: corrinoid protein [Acidimicrobiia bacterium]|nr:MAG: corrinoid protein [Acidimicrobiia bacterium]